MFLSSRMKDNDEIKKREKTVDHSPQSQSQISTKVTSLLLV